MKIYLISDAFTQQSLLLENISVKENWFFLRKNKSIIFVESAWRGYQDRWKYKIASYPDYPERTFGIRKMASILTVLLTPLSILTIFLQWMLIVLNVIVPLYQVRQP